MSRKTFAEEQIVYPLFASHQVSRRSWSPGRSAAASAAVPGVIVETLADVSQSVSLAAWRAEGFAIRSFSCATRRAMASFREAPAACRDLGGRWSVTTDSMALYTPSRWPATALSSCVTGGSGPFRAAPRTGVGRAPASNDGRAKRRFLMQNCPYRLVADAKVRGQLPQAAGASRGPDRGLLLRRELAPPWRMIGGPLGPTAHSARRGLGDDDQAGQQMTQARERPPSNPRSQL